MAFSNGNIFVASLDVTPGGALTAYSQYISNVELTSERSTEKLARGGGNAKAALVGAVEHDGTIDFWYDPAFVDVLRAHMDQATPVSCTLNWKPQGTGATLPMRVAEIFLTNLREQTNADNPAEGSVDFTIDGAITTTAQA